MNRTIYTTPKSARLGQRLTIGMETTHAQEKITRSTTCDATVEGCSIFHRQRLRCTYKQARLLHPSETHKTEAKHPARPTLPRLGPAVHRYTVHTAYSRWGTQHPHPGPRVRAHRESEALRSCARQNADGVHFQRLPPHTRLPPTLPVLALAGYRLSYLDALHQIQQGAPSLIVGRASFFRLGLEG